MNMANTSLEKCLGLIISKARILLGKCLGFNYRNCMYKEKCTVLGRCSGGGECEFGCVFVFDKNVLWYGKTI